jgi:hypothetical protein
MQRTNRINRKNYCKKFQKWKFNWLYRFYNRFV